MLLWRKWFSLTMVMPFFDKEDENILKQGNDCEEDFTEQVKNQVKNDPEEAMDG